MGSGMLVGTDVRLRPGADGGAVSTHPAALYETFEPLTRVHDTVTLFARHAPSSMAGVGTATGPGVRASFAPDFSSPVSLLTAMPRTLGRAWREVGRHEVVMGRVPEPLSIVLGCIAVVRGKPFIANVVADPTNPRLGSGRVRSAIDGLVLRGVRWLVRHSAATIYVTETYLQRLCPPHPARPTLVRSNVRLDDAWFRLARQEGPLPPARVVLVGSNQSWGKGQRVLLDATARLVADGFPLHITFVGGGRLVDDIREEARARGLAEHVTVLGQIESRAQLAEVLDAHDVFCLPSLSEGLPRAMVEAMARGLPVVGSDAGGIPELAPADAIAPVGDAIALARALRRVIEDQAPEQRSRHSVETARRVADQARVETLVEFLEGLDLRS